MRSIWKAGLLTGVAIVALGTVSQAQNPPDISAAPRAAAASDSPVYDPDQLPAVNGTVWQFTLTPRGDIDGLILTDGTEVKTPPHLSSEIAFSVMPGDKVVIHGLRAAALPLVRAVSITDEATKNTVVDDGPRGPGRRPPPPGGPAAPPPPPGANVTEATGRVRMSLHGPEGDINGALLEDGTVLRVPPPDAYRLASLLAPGQTVFAQGSAFASPLGKVMDVERIGSSRDQLDDVTAPPPRPRRPRS
jgi:hypothetical protein